MTYNLAFLAASAGSQLFSDTRSAGLHSNIIIKPFKPAPTPARKALLNQLSMRDYHEEGHLQDLNPFDDLLENKEFSSIFSLASNNNIDDESKSSAVFVAGSFKSAVEANDLTDFTTAGLNSQEELKSTSKTADKKSVINNRPARDPKINQQTKQFLNVIDRTKSTMSDRVVNRIVNDWKDSIQKNCRPGSYFAKFLCTALDILKGSEEYTPEIREEFVYFITKTLSVLDETAQTDNATNKTPISLYHSLAIDGIDSLISNPQKIDRFGLFSAYKQVFDFMAGERKDRGYNMLEGYKNQFLNSLGKEDVNSLATKVKLALFVIFSIDTGKNVNAKDFVEIFHKLGIIISKVAQTVGNQANNPVFKDGGTKQAVIEACKELQQYNKPMSAAEAHSQMAAYYEKQFGSRWERKMFKSIDFSSPIKTGTIAGIYKAITVDDREVVVKIKKPIEEKLAMEKGQVAQLLTSAYTILQEAVDSYTRVGIPVPDILSKGNLFQRSKMTTQSFLDRFEAELKLENEAIAMMGTSCLTPEVISFSPNTIIMEYIDNGLSPFEYIEICEKSKTIDYAKSSDPVNAVKGWLQTHYPLEINEIKLTKTSLANDAIIKVRFSEGGNEQMVFNVSKKRGDWKVVPNEQYIDFAPTARRQVATQSIVDVIKQLSDGTLNCDAHAGNFIIAAGNHPGKNLVYNIDFGLTVKVNANESKLAWNFIKGVLMNNEIDIAKSYLDMTDRGQSLSEEDYNRNANRLGKVLKDCKYTKMLAENPDKAAGPVMEWLADENFNINEKFYAIIRSFSGVASNAATLQGNSSISLQQIAYLSRELIENQLKTNHR